jgi:hypothetical protein
MQQEPDFPIKQLWELHLNMEISQLQKACEMMVKPENRDPESFLPKELPAPISFQENKDYIRQVLESPMNESRNESAKAKVAASPSCIPRSQSVLGG